MADFGRSSLSGVYRKTYNKLFGSNVNINCRGKQIAYELINYRSAFRIQETGIGVIADQNCYVTPIDFVLSEFIWFMGQNQELKYVKKYNSNIEHYSDDGYTLYGAYGPRLFSWIPVLIKRLVDDKHSRQAYVTSIKPGDYFYQGKDFPCNTSIQLLIRDEQLIMIVGSRSSDFITGFPIDCVHWQMLYHLILNELKIYYPLLMTGYIGYNIGSLHVYQDDKEKFDQWNLIDDPDIVYLGLPTSTFLGFKIGAQDMIQNDSYDFDSIYKFGSQDREILEMLRNKFKNRKHRYTR